MAVRIARPAIAAEATVAADIPPEVDIPAVAEEGIREAVATAVVAIAKQNGCFGKAELQ